MESFLLLASIYLGTAVLVVPVAVRLGLGSVLGYLAAGILLGPILGLAGAEITDLQHFAEFGVVLMLFLIGLELEPKSLWDMRHKLLGLGGSQVVLTMLAIMAAALALGQSMSVAVVAGMVGALSSTAIVLQTLNEKNLMRTPGGRSTFSVLLTQDIAVIPMLALIPLLSLPETTAIDSSTIGVTNPDLVTDHSAGAAEPLLTIIQSLPGWAATLLTLATVAAIVLGGHYLSRPVFRFVHAAKLPEMSTFISLLMVLGIAFLMILVGLSPALGTFVAGVVLANSEFRHQLEADLKPFKGLLLGLFFMTVGVGINFGIILRSPFTVLGLTLGLILFKAAILFGLALVFKLKGKDRWLFSLGLAQAGEFGFVISLSMLLTPLLFIAQERLAQRFGRKSKERSPDEVDERGQVLIAGIGRFGQVVNRLVRTSGLSTVVLDSDMATIERMRRFGVKGFFGDPSRPELLMAAGLQEAQVLVVAVDNRTNATNIVKFARATRPDLHIIARAIDRVHVYELYQAGANDTVRETFDSSVRAGRYVLENMGFSEYEAAKMSQAYWRIDRAAMRDLAELWVPGQPVSDNAAYVARARQLDSDLELALMDVLYDVRPMAAEDPVAGPGGHPPPADPDGAADSLDDADQLPAETPASAKVNMPE
jgi:monovalent cation:H+ antiporter-2, CPA2 family